MTIIELIFVFIFCLWILCTILKQIFNKKMPKAINSFSSMGFSFFFPIFTLFAPRPANSDFHITYRYFGGKKSELKNIEYNFKRKLYNIIWNPNGKSQKMIINAVRNIDATKKSLEEKKFEKTKINRILFSSKSFLLIKRIVLQDLLKNNDLRKGEFQIIIFKSIYVENEIKYMPYYFHTFEI